jgi:hypothetical protein
MTHLYTLYSIQYHLAGVSIMTGSTGNRYRRITDQWMRHLEIFFINGACPYHAFKETGPVDAIIVFID